MEYIFQCYWNMGKSGNVTNEKLTTEDTKFHGEEGGFCYNIISLFEGKLSCFFLNYVTLFNY